VKSRFLYCSLREIETYRTAHSNHPIVKLTNWHAEHILVYDADVFASSGRSAPWHTPKERGIEQAGVRTARNISQNTTGASSCGPCLVARCGEPGLWRDPQRPADPPASSL
jgi:hypothetical protein